MVRIVTANNGAKKDLRVYIIAGVHYRYWFEGSEVPQIKPGKKVKASFDFIAPNSVW
jgi:hypothetical protein